MKHSVDDRLTRHGIKPTPNRVLVMRELVGASQPLSLTELEDRIGSLDRSSVFRVLTLLLSHHAVHAVEDGRGVVKYELCLGSHSESDGHMHVHFYCERCRQVFCFPSTPAPAVEFPDGFSANSVNYMLKGVCPDCNK